MAGVATVRASRRPKKISTSGRATWVERTRSWGAWKVATLSEKEWRSAVEETRGAKGSWTWTMSKGVDARRFLTASPEPRTTTSCPRRPSSSETRLTYSLTGFAVPRRCGVTWAIERRLGRHTCSIRGRAVAASGQASVFASVFAAPATGLLPRAYVAMNSSVCSRASSSGRWLCGDFIR